MIPILFPELAEPEVAPANIPAPSAPAATTGAATGAAARGVGSRPSVGTGLEEMSTGCDWSASAYRGCATGSLPGCATGWLPGCATGWGDCGERFGRARPHECGRAVEVDTHFVAALRRDLRSRVKPGAHIAFGTTVDPYPSMEMRERVTFRALSTLLDAHDLRVSVTTRSTLVARDAQLLGLLAQRHAVHVNIVIATPDSRLARFLEPDAPEPTDRLQALHALRRRGVEAGVLLTPLLPGITDAESDLGTLCAEASEAGARWLGARLVVPAGPARARLLHALRRAYPRVAARYAWWTRYSDTDPGSGAQRRPSTRRSEGRRRPEDTASLASVSDGSRTVRRVHRLASRHALAARPDLSLPVPQRSRQATFAFVPESTSGGEASIGVPPVT